MVRLFRLSAVSGVLAVKPHWPGENAIVRAAPRLGPRRDHVCFKAALSQGPGFAPRNSQEQPPRPQMARKRRWAGQFRAETLHYPPNRRSGPENAWNMPVICIKNAIRQVTLHFCANMTRLASSTCRLWSRGVLPGVSWGWLGPLA